MKIAPWLGKSALVVEDERDYADLIARALKGQGFAVRIASDGAEALETARTIRPDVITLDIQMPGETGISFFRRLRASPGFREVPIIVITGLTPGDPDMNAIIRTMLEPDHCVPPVTYLEKPFLAADLIEAVSAAVGGVDASTG